MSVVNKSTLFPATLAKEMFSKIVGHSSLAKLSASEPIPFNGKDIFTFDFSNNVSVVGEGGTKPAGDAAVTAKQIRPVKVVYQSRVSNEFMYASEEARIPYLQAFADGFSKKVAAGFDIMAMHGLNPATGSASDVIGTNHLDSVIPSANKIVLGHDSSAIDANIEEAIAKVEDAEYAVTGVILAPAARTAMSNLTQNTGERKYPDFAFGAYPSALGSGSLDVNPTVSFNSGKNRVYAGDFRNALRWGYSKEIPLEIIEYGNPDGGTYDLKQVNQVLLRSEVFIGWCFLDGNRFARVYVSP